MEHTPDSIVSDSPTDGFADPRPILVVTPDDRLAGSLFAALDQLTWPFQRAGSLHEAARLCRQQAFELLLIDVRLVAPYQDPTQALPEELRAGLNAETPWLPVARGNEWERPDAAVLCYDGAVASSAIAEYIAAELERGAETRLLTAARLLVAAPSRMSAVPIPPALEAAHRLDWMYIHDPSLENAAAVVARQEHLAKHVIRLAHALSGDADMRSWELGRVLLHIGLLRFIPLVKIVAARSMFPVRDPGRRQALDAIWRFSVARAVAMRWMALRMQTDDLDASWRMAFDAGLFADAGAGLLIWLLDQSEPRRLRPRPSGPLSVQLVAQHEWFGEKLLDRWKLRRAISMVAGGHHVGRGSPKACLSALSLAAGAVAEDAGMGPDPTGIGSSRPVALAFQQLAISAADRLHVTSLVRVEIERIDEAFVR